MTTLPDIPQNSLTCTLTVTRPAGEVANCICRVADWWATHVTGPTSRPGDRFTVRFGKTFSGMIVSERTDQRIVWTVADSCLPLFRDAAQWEGTRIIWEITTGQGGTRVVMTHAGLTPGLECFEDCRAGWGYYVGTSLAALITTGKGSPGCGIFCHLAGGADRLEGILYYRNDPMPDPGRSLFVDVRETRGEEVISAHAIGVYDRATFHPGRLAGEYFMLLDPPETTKSHSLEDIFKLLNY